MVNQTIFQFFHWYLSPDSNLWKQASEQAARLAGLGVTWVWLPPAYKSASGINEPGYAVYDLYDLGEFEQKGTLRTRYGTKEEYLTAIRTLQNHGVRVMADIVLNHMTGGDEKEQVPAQKVKEENRNEAIDEPYTVEAHTRFTFPGRNGKYSDYQWDWRSFTGLCEDGIIHLIHHEHSNGTWDDVLENEYGNYDYLLGCDVEFRNPHVREELKRWGVWYVETTGVDGFRLDALKHITPDFYPEWLDHLNRHAGRSFFCIGEFWKSDAGHLLKYIDATGGGIQLFDVPLHFSFYDASIKGAHFDMRTIFENTLVSARPDLAITFVDNHDTQPMQSLQSTVEFWFKPLAYAMILLREQGIPCVFYPALYEARYSERQGDKEVYIELNKVPCIEELMILRRDIAYGGQHDYFDHPNVVGWTREGIPEMPGSGCAVLLSNSDEGYKTMHMGASQAGNIFVDALGRRNEKITLGSDGEAEFKVNAGSVSVWVNEKWLESKRKK